MQITTLDKIKEPVSFTVGAFDGIHLGHQRLLAELKNRSRANRSASLVVSFDPHPRTVVNPDYKMELITTADERAELIAAAGIDYLAIIPFTQDFSKLSPLEFYEKFLFNFIHPRYVLIGFNHAFGSGRSGTLELIRELAERHSFEYGSLDAVDLLDSHISSTAIRNYLKEGAVLQAHRMLGRPYSLSGRVIRGQQIGRSLGYPTANLMLHTPQKLIPAGGVYLTSVQTAEGLYYGMTNIGLNPTFPGKGHSIETHIFDFNNDLYDQSIRLSFLRRIREEQKFLRVTDLVTTLKEDERRCRAILTQERHLQTDI